MSIKQVLTVKLQLGVSSNSRQRMKKQSKNAMEKFLDLEDPTSS